MIISEHQLRTWLLKDLPCRDDGVGDLEVVPAGRNQIGSETALFTLRRHTAESHHAARETAERTMNPAKMCFKELDIMLAIKERATN